ncbi:penicillin-binding protein activator [Serratia plymuthica]|uniref:Penicillin-binding protein activator LpoA n=1 Tax=Serratia plymuthica S13 TaxID=1348660 RepID=S4YL84_SERPL|nr:penicillin-binding protein activator [Serratia plymuthica]AGP46137.1 penicillin-binding protein activator LpoA [Serratia plymuthica S13]ANJ94009.1 penicillin-binding protein [Serratia plymuthica]ANK00562.1 penicillin-binding protein [Serratia plymuthica]EKF62471.1 penicillin-binding protein activator LpoA [Serratia plymuthica A30]KYG17542.1 Penicillin-binding protein activator LpoA precursor [Serratia plymuthica]
MLSSTFVRTKAGRSKPVRLTAVIAAALFLAGCPSQAPQTPPANIQDEASASSDYYLKQLQQSSDDNKADWQLLAIRALLREGKLPQAGEQLNQLPKNLSSVQQVERQLLTAELQVANKSYVSARSTLGHLDSGSLSANQLVRFYQAQIAANQGKPSLPLIRAYVAQEPLLTGKAHQTNLDQTWQALLQLTPQDMNSLVINANENVLQGWLDLLRVYQDNKQDPDLLKAGIKDWQNRYPQNPAAKTLPTQLNQVLNFTQASTSKIALLLPLNGQAKVFADAIQQGFEAAKNGVAAPAQVQQQQQPANNPVQAAAPADANANGAVSTSAPSADAAPVTAAQPSTASNAQITPPQATNAQIKVYDTTSQPLAALLTQAQQDGATLVVGPLLKENVDQLSGSNTTLNVLALNQPETPKDNPNICYFALSPEDEARDAARHIWEQQKRQPLLLIPRGSFGDRVAKAFNQEWQKLGGQTVLQQGIGSAGELRQAVNSGGIRMSGTPISAAPAPQAVTIAGLTIPAPPSDVPAESGGNVDAVYIVATQSQLTLIKPMIDMATTSRSKPAMYASSRSYQAGAGPDFRLEMEGLQFSDIPLLAGANPQLLQQASSRFRNDYSLVRLYAMGMDAWTLANHFAEMRQLPGFQVSGTTGMLTASPSCVINRKLPWLQYRQGMVVPVS